MNRIRGQAVVQRLFKKMDFKYGDIDEIQLILLNGEFSSPNEYVSIKINVEGGSFSYPFRFDWFAKMVEYYGIDKAVSYSVMVLLKWLV